MLADLLLRHKAVEPGMLDRCLREHRESGAPLARVLVRREAIAEGALLDLLAAEMSMPRVSLGSPIDGAAVEAVPSRVAHHYGLMPAGWEGGTLKAAFSFPPDAQLLDELRVVLRREILPVLAPAGEIEKALKAHYGVGTETLERLQEEAGPAGAERKADGDLEAAQDASVVKFVNQILLEAYRRGATDIHIEPYPEELRVRCRVDGVLYDVKTPASLKRFQAAIASRLKVMADLPIAEKRLPLDGRIAVSVGGQDMDLRISTLPTPFGESIGIRLLTSRRLLDLAHLGYAEGDLRRLEGYLDKPHGIVLVTGPTGSGKTTTLYAFLRRINGPEKKIITLEDPIEYQMRGVTQVQVNPKVGLSFAQGLRSMLRHDPDVMMVGEIRDAETAEIAVRVALTGHLVFSTLHTNDAASAVTRLQDIGVEPYLISSSILCVVAQRLVRVICPECRSEAPLEGPLLAEFGLGREEAGLTVFEGKGCEACQGTGFRGRTVIYEIFPLAAEIRELVMSRAPAPLLREKAVAQGMKTLRRCGWEKVKQGVTTPQEVLRATLAEGA